MVVKGVAEIQATQLSSTDSKCMQKECVCTRFGEYWDKGFSLRLTLLILLLYLYFFLFYHQKNLFLSQFSFFCY